MPKSRDSWDNHKLNRKLDMALRSLRRELWAAAKRQNDLTDDYIADLIRRALWNKQWTPGETLKNNWRYEHL